MKDTAIKEESSTSEIKTLPNHIAIIMDGNRRWAKDKNLPAMFGHKEGVQSLKKISRYSDDLGIKYLTVYAFSTENWNRKKDEVDFLMFLVQDALKAEIDELHSENVRIRFIGFINEMPEPLPTVLQSAMEKTKNNTGLNLQVALNYGSRREITHAVKEIAKEVLERKLNAEDITTETITSHLLTKDIPEPDLLIRTGGEFRISNYLLWQSAYSEFYSTNTLWPDFNQKELDKAILEFGNRQRRFGK